MILCGDKDAALKKLMKVGLKNEELPMITSNDDDFIKFFID